MFKKVSTLVVLLTALFAMPLRAQTSPARPDPMVASIQDGANHLRYLFTTAAEEMSEDDYTFRPTPDVRGFEQILAHVVESNYWFCSTAMGEEAPVSSIPDSAMSREDVQEALSASFDYCDQAYAAMADEMKASAMRDIMGKQRPALAVLNFRIYHGMLHWGNVVTYMRLRGRIPPSN